MEITPIITQFITEWGTFGLVLAIMGWMIYDNWKYNKRGRYNNDTKNVLNEIKNVSGKVDNLHDKIILVDEKVDDVSNIFDKRIDSLENKVNDLPQMHIEELKSFNKDNSERHTKEMVDLLRLGPDIHNTLKYYNERICGDHIFIGSFHNGNRSITGIPYYKFDIIAERFKEDAVEQDCEFAYMYKDSDILRFDKLPILLVQKNMLHYTVPENGKVSMADIDDIIWRRMRGRGIKQIALHILKDKSDTPSGFVGVVKYDFEKFNLEELKICAKRLEMDYHKAEDNIK